MPTITLPAGAGELAAYRLTGTPIAIAPPPNPFNRVALAAAHVVAVPPDHAPTGAGPLALDLEQPVAVGGGVEGPAPSGRRQGPDLREIPRGLGREQQVHPASQREIT